MNKISKAMTPILISLGILAIFFVNLYIVFMCITSNENETSCTWLFIAVIAGVAFDFTPYITILHELGHVLHLKMFCLKYKNDNEVAFYYINYTNYRKAKTTSNIYRFMANQYPSSRKDISASASAGTVFACITVFPLALLSLLSLSFPKFSLINQSFACIPASFSLALIFTEILSFLLGDSKTKDYVFFWHPEKFVSLYQHLSKECNLKYKRNSNQWFNITASKESASPI